MPFKSLKITLSNLLTPFVSNAISNFKTGTAKDAGKVSAQLLKKGPFDIPDDAPSQNLIENPLSFNPVQYPLRFR